ncbi:hypothetical protein NONI108955_24240 [Nocardia ninae]|uniref:Uncharacterized protein n=1 Tax=Nocardia ninae NBRC 108245 TaxID=1210091 RepID=A0A511MEU3_9NOCA|nr:hypothetical protein [Nocardia ninae]GEM38951.1 hypothetical protein NN4_34700 [Nocardia ninae NBRC 108245]
MALYAEIQKLDEDSGHIRYGYTDVEGVQRTLLLDKAAETIGLESGSEDMLYRAVARKIASAWVNGLVPDHMIVQS